MNAMVILTVLLTSQGASANGVTSLKKSCTPFVDDLNIRNKMLPLLIELLSWDTDGRPTVSYG